MSTIWLPIRFEFNQFYDAQYNFLNSIRFNEDDKQQEMVFPRKLVDSLKTNIN